ncbi:MAG TPA: hypothetical protein DEQ38_10885 [Elusimicrobia bacterium]|nr:MAG: hypothetical protein A2089_06705 [Elusimicrobia bacterium GWD2_63_28]HCC48601.1 hypothetical protein [Elusimicrobiota bacterium]
MKKIILAFALSCCPHAAYAGEAGCLYNLKGTVEIKAAAGQWAPALKGRPVAEGDAVRTGKGAWCEILFRDGSFIKMDAQSETAAEELKAGAQERVFSFSFLRGRALWLAGKVAPGKKSKFQVRTPSAVCAVRGTDFSVDVSTSGETTVGLFEGRLAVSGAGAEKELAAGSEAYAASAGLAVSGRFSRLMAAEKKRYAKVRNRAQSLRKRLAEREDFIDDYIGRQRKKLSDFESRREEKLRGKK